MAQDLRALISKAKSAPAPVQAQTQKLNPLQALAKKNENSAAVDPPSTAPDTGALHANEVKTPNSLVQTGGPPKSAAPVISSINAEEYQFESQPDKLPDSEEADFRESLKMLEANMPNKELVGQTTIHIMQTVQENPNLAAFLLPEDIRLLVRGLREAYSVVALKKTEKKATRVAKRTEVDDIMNTLIEAGVNKK